jgi:hypothetical protein
MEVTMHPTIVVLSRCFGGLAALAVLSLLGGCSTGGLDGAYPARGTLTYKGQPVDGAMISLVGDNNARPATAVSKADGTFELLTQGSPGAFPGNYKVVVIKTEAGASQADPGFSPDGQDLSMEQAAVAARKPPPKAKELLPAKYSSPQTTPLTCEVKASNENVFELKLE